MRTPLGCVIAGLLILVFLYFAFYLAAMVEPGIAILILIAGIFVGAAVAVAAIVWVAGLFARHRDGGE